MSTIPANEIRDALIKDLKLKEKMLPAKSSGLDELREKLIPIIEKMLQEDLPKLMNILYRIDVDEVLVRKALNTPFFEESARELANLILDRQIKKIEIRKRYS